MQQVIDAFEELLRLFRGDVGLRRSRSAGMGLRCGAAGQPDSNKGAQEQPGKQTGRDAAREHEFLSAAETGAVVWASDRVARGQPAGMYAIAFAAWGKSVGRWIRMGGNWAAL